MTDHYDALETRGADEREAAQFAQLRALIDHAPGRAPAWAKRLAGVVSTDIVSRAELAQLPVLRKHELLEAQGDPDASDAFGGFSAVGWGAGRDADHRALRVFASPGPIHEPDTARRDYWRMARALFAAGFRAGDLVHNTFSYHFTPAGAMMESAAQAIGCTTFPAGTGQTEQQVQAMRRLRPDAYIGTPSFLKLILDKAAESGVAIASLRRASVGGEAFPAALRDTFAARGVQALQSYGTADLGLVAYETDSHEGLVVDEGVIVEIVRPGSGDPAGAGEIGEVVVTALNNAYPMIRFGTGDLSAVLPGVCPTGRSNMRIRGWLGRADPSAKVRGLFVHPPFVTELMRRLPEIVRARLVVDGEPGVDRMTLEAELRGAEPEGFSARAAETIRDVTKLRGEVAVKPPGSLPNDGKLVVDLRSPV